MPNAKESADNSVPDHEKFRRGLAYYQEELCVFEPEWKLGRFSAQLPGSKDKHSPCLVFQTPLSLFVIFPEVAVRFDQPFDFKMLTPRKGQRAKDGETQLTQHKLTARLGGKDVSTLFLRDVGMDLTYKFSREELADENDWHSIRKDFEVAFLDMEYVFSKLLFDLTRNEKPIGPVPLSMRMFVDALYTGLIKYHHQVLKDFKAAGDYHDSPEEIQFSQGIILRMLLEYGQKPNKYGCYGQGSKIYPDILSGNSCRPGLSLNSIQEIIEEFDAELAEVYETTVNTLLGIYLHHVFGNTDYANSEASSYIDWD